MTKKKSKSPLLISLLTPLLQEWGYDAVRQCLAEVQAGQVKEDFSRAEHKPKPTKAHRRPSAVEMVERLDATADQKESLHVLASRFDTKTFLPTASDVRHFLEMRGQSSSPIKQRQDAFRKVLDLLLSMADDELMLLQTSGTHGGPTQLGPLSDAIKATSAAVRNTESHTEPAVAEESVEPRIKPAGGSQVKS
jgi:hypothetical protein